MIHKGSTLSALLLVAGTCVGGGMLALPIATGVSGFWPSIAVMTFCCLAMTLTGLLLLEAALWFQEGAHIITITTKILGIWGKSASWLLFLFISYASLVAYAAGGGTQISGFFQAVFSVAISRDLSCALFTLFLTVAMCMGSWFVGRVNSLLFIAMVGAYLLLVGFGLDEIKPALLKYMRWRRSFIAVPLLLTAFSFQTMVPSLVPYLHKNIKALRRAIIGGTILAFFIYFIWFSIIFGIVPVEGPNGLAQALTKGDQPVTQFLQMHVAGVRVSAVAEYFAFFAIITSFLGIAFGLYDFLADGLGIDKSKAWGKGALVLLMLIPTIVFATRFERAFIIAMDASGGIGDALLNGLIPVFLVWKGRKIISDDIFYRVRGGKAILVVVALFFLTSFLIEISGICGLIPSIYNAYDIVEIHNAEEILQ